MEKGEYLECRIVDDKVQLKLTPNNCTFKNNFYTDLLVLESEQEYKSFKI